MTKEAFIVAFADILAIQPEDLTERTRMDSLEGWDSVGYLSAMVLIDERLGITVDPDLLPNVQYFGDILQSVSAKLEA